MLMHPKVTAALNSVFPPKQRLALDAMKENARARKEADEFDDVDQHIANIIDDTRASELILQAAFGGTGSDENRNVTGEDTSLFLIAETANRRVNDRNYLLSVLEHGEMSNEFFGSPEEIVERISDEVRQTTERISASLTAKKAA
jgi:hypothetical protein